MTSTALALVQLLGAALALALAGYAYRRRDQPGIIWLLAVLLGDAVWMIAAGLNYASSSIAVSTALLQGRYLGITVIPVALLFFALSYTGYDDTLNVTRRHRVLIALPALGALLLALTDGVHGLFYASITPAATPNHVAYEYGTLAVPWISYAFVLTVIAAATFARYALVSEGVYRWQALTLAGVVSLGIVADVLFFLPVPPTGFAVTPLAILLSSAIAIGIIDRYEFVRLVPATRELGRKELIEQMELGMLVIDAEGRVVDVNPAGATILGRQQEDLLGGRVPSGLPVSDGQTVVERTYTIDGIDRDVEIRTSQVGDHAGITLVTLQPLEDFTGMISHDLQGPLMEIRGSADLAITTGDITHVDHVLSAANRIDELVSDLLQLSQTGRHLECREPVDLAAVSQTAWSNVWAPNATITVETTQCVVGDPNRIQQLLENVFRNSVEHGHPEQQEGHLEGNGGGAGDAGEIETSTPRSERVVTRGYRDESEGDPTRSTTGVTELQVTVGSMPDGFYVEDTGPGFPPGERERVFEKGYTNSPTGTGLGLSIVRQIANAHGWSVRATDGTTGGARLEFTGVEIGDE